MFTILAVYENGVLRPTTPLTLEEGQQVQVAVTPAPDLTPMPEDEWDRRAENVKTIQEWIELANRIPNPDPHYDVVREINKTRRETGFRLPDPEPEGEGQT